MKTLFRSLAVASLLALGSGAATGTALAAGAAGQAADGRVVGPDTGIQTVQDYRVGPRERWVEGEGRRDWRDERPRDDWRDSRPPSERWDGPPRRWERPPPHWRRPPPYYGPGPGIYFEFGNEPRYYRREPRYREVVPARRLSAAHVRWCERRYRSYRAWDNTFQPYGGPRQQCWSPYS